MQICSLQQKFVQDALHTVVTNHNGTITSSQSTLFNFDASFGENYVFSNFPFLEAIWSDVLNRSIKDFPCVEITFAGKDLFLDFYFVVDEQNVGIHIVHFSRHYLRSREIQQVRNNSMIENMEINAENENLKEIQAFKDRFMANMSHEVRTPLNAILGFSQILLEEPNHPQKQNYVGLIDKAASHMLALVNDILDFSQLELNKLKISPSIINIYELVENVQKLYQVKAAERKNTIQLHIDSAIPSSIYADGVRLNQILQNLVSNAVKFTQNGTVNIEVNQISNQNNLVELQFIVSDTGMGIPKQDLDRIFEGFEQATNNDIGKFGGTGLGLSIVKKLVDLQNGILDLKSTVGEGTQFIITIPFEKRNTEDKIEHFSGLKKLAKDKPNVLLVEDNEMNQILTEMMLKKHQFEVTIADNGVNALQKLEQNDFDIVLMDIKMPEMDGYETARQIRAKQVDKYQEIPIIAMTGFALETEKEACLQCGMNDYISKPFNFDVLLNKIVNLL